MVTVEEVLKELAASEAVDIILTAHPELDATRSRPR